MAERSSIWQRPALAFVAAGVMITPILVGCGGPNNTSGANMPPVDDTRGGVYTQQQQTRSGMSTGQKLAILAGAAALYYMYKKNKEKRAVGDTSVPQYYLSRNGRVYYRDSTGQAHWVTAPASGIQVPMAEAQQYQQFQGYNNQAYGRDLSGLGID